MSARPVARRRVDLLDREHTRGRITANALDVGRRLQLSLEAAHRSGGTAWGAKVDTSPAGDAAAVSAVEATRRAERMLEWSRRAIGDDLGLVAAVLADGSGFAEAAARAGLSGRRATGRVAAQFRGALERLALAQRAVGARAEQVDDKHSAAAANLNARIRSSDAA